jgi:hypothetical protein
MDFIVNHLVEIFFGLVSARLLAACKHMHKEAQAYRKLLEEQDHAETRKVIVQELEPIIHEIERVKHASEMRAKDINERLDKYEQRHTYELNLMLASYKFRMIQLCKTHLADGYITQADFDQISEFYKLYHGLGGNGQAQEYYDKVMELKIVNEPPLK